MRTTAYIAEDAIWEIHARATFQGAAILKSMRNRMM